MEREAEFVCENSNQIIPNIDEGKTIKRGEKWKDFKNKTARVKSKNVCDRDV